ncbi:copper resistance protein NlpE [Shewanella sp.]|uniref:copper resistance protein NlpE n=1 Tax=Shewanella sp. TaxID=50422 RepID=UPI0040486152
MKRIGILLVIFALIACDQPEPTAHDITASSKHSIQWQGVYHGVFPCPSCEGMDTTIELSLPNNYTIDTVRLGNDPLSYSGSGTFQWDKTGNIIILDRGHIYQVYADHLYLLDVEFKRIKGPDAERYRVDKIKGLGSISPN